MSVKLAIDSQASPLSSNERLTDFIVHWIGSKAKIKEDGQIIAMSKSHYSQMLLVQSEEEINKMCTREDLTELQWSITLLRRGYEIQKLSVSTT